MQIYDSSYCALYKCSNSKEMQQQQIEFPAALYPALLEIPTLEHLSQSSKVNPINLKHSLGVNLRMR